MNSNLLYWLAAIVLCALVFAGLFAVLRTAPFLAALALLLILAAALRAIQEERELISETDLYEKKDKQ